MSDKVVIDLTENFAKIGEDVDFSGEYKLDDGLLPYPNAKLVRVKVHFHISYNKPNVKIEGVIGCVVQGYCDRCLEPINRQIDLPFCQIFYKDSSDEEDGYVYSESRLDATKAVCDEIVLSLPGSLLCKQDCKGLCPKCGTNLNQRQCDCDLSRENAFSVLKDLKF